MSFKKLPYGKSNFADLIESGFAYVDKTRFIESLENENNAYQFFIRPRRFGKSLFLSTLEHYYNINEKDKFESIFGNLYIGKHPTPERNTYAIMKFNFSGLDTGSHEKFEVSFLNRIEQNVSVFLEDYKNLFSESANFLQEIREQKPGVGALDFAYRAARESGVPIFVIIDEYDHFANNLIAMGEKYTEDVKRGGIVRTFYEQIKSGTDSVVRRIFITGISPMMVNDLTSGFNISDNYSLDAIYNEMLGFTKEEVKWLMQESGVDKVKIKVDIETYYNGYMFNKNGKNKVYNPQMVLFLFNQILRLGEQPEEIIDHNLRTDYSRLRRLAENENNRKKLLQIVKDGGIFGEIIRDFSLDLLNSEEYFISLMFYLGMLTNGGTIEGRNWLKIPNYSIKTLYWGYVVSLAQDFEEKQISTIDLSEVMSKMAYRGDFKPYLDFFTENYLKRLSNRDLIDFDEKLIKVMLLSTLFTSKFYLPVSDPEGAGSKATTNENVNGYTDIYLQKSLSAQDMKFEYIFELKYLKTDAKTNEKEAKLAEALEQLKKYRKDARFANRSDIKFVAIVFVGKSDYVAKELV